MIGLAAIVFCGSLVLVVLSLCWLVMEQQEDSPSYRAASEYGEPGNTIKLYPSAAEATYKVEVVEEGGVVAGYKLNA